MRNVLLDMQTVWQEVSGSQFDGCLNPIQSPVLLSNMALGDVCQTAPNGKSPPWKGQDHW